MDKKRLNVRYDLLVMLVLVLATAVVYKNALAMHNKKQ
jgi:hypothetical protein